MTRRMIERRLRALRDADERGFTILETMIAITVVFASLTALAYTATIGFRYIALGRERIQATAMANKIMESIRGYTYVTVSGGMKTSDLTGDTNIKSCSGGVYRLDSCTTGEKIVHSSGVGSTAYIMPHVGTITEGTLTATYKAYITNNDPTVNPYRVTVLVSFATDATVAAAATTVRIQSLFWSPAGCISSATHPFAAPCQPYFYGQALVPTSTLKITNTYLHDIDLEEASLKSAGVESNVQQEQVSAITSSVTQPAVSMTRGGVLSTAGGGTSSTSAADTDPAGSTPTYATTSPSGSGGSLNVVQTDPPNTVGLTVSAPSGTTSTATAAATANGSNICPPPSDTAETDSLACAGARVQRGGALTATVPMTHLNSSLGTANLINWSVSTGNPNKTLVDREAITGQNGRIEMSASRFLGSISVGGRPPGMTAPAGWAGGNAWNGYCFTLHDYRDSSASQAGTTTSAPTVTQTGTFYYWNGASYSSVAIASMGSLALPITCSQTATVGGASVTWLARLTSVTAPTTASNATITSGSTRTDVDTTATPPRFTILYRVTVNGVTEVDMTVDSILGNLVTRGVYGPPPPAG